MRSRPVMLPSRVIPICSAKGRKRVRVSRTAGRFDGCRGETLSVTPSRATALAIRRLAGVNLFCLSPGYGPAAPSPAWANGAAALAAHFPAPAPALRLSSFLYVPQRKPGAAAAGHDQAGIVIEFDAACAVILKQPQQTIAFGGRAERPTRFPCPLPRGRSCRRRCGSAGRQGPVWCAWSGVSARAAAPDSAPNPRMSAARPGSRSHRLKLCTIGIG